MLRPRLMRPAWLLVVFVAVAELPATRALAASSPTGSAAAVPTQPSALPPLPKVPSIELPKPDKQDLADLDALLSRLGAKDSMVRDQAVKEILEVQPRLVPAIAERLDSIADKADRDAMKRVLHDARRKARKEVREKMRAAGEKSRVKTPDYLVVLADHAKPDSKAWQNLISVVGMSRMLVHIGSVDAVRVLIDVYVRFGEFLRIDTQLQLEKLGDKAVAALIEARRHPAKKIAHWADRELDMMGKAIPGEAIHTDDYAVLADVLRAYGRVRDPDAARVVISFANSERAQVRLAARQAVVMMGDVANWQLRDTYETIVGDKPPRDWDWKRTARELFGRFDRQRMARVYHLFDDGMAAYRAGRLDAMRTNFNKVLAQSPMFEHRSDMLPGYVAYAKKYADQHPADALDALRRAERIAPDDKAEEPIKSLRLTLEGERLLGRGIADQTLFRRALDLDPGNSRARDALSRIEHGELTRHSRSRRYAAAGAIGAAALLAIAFVGLWRPRRPSEPESPGDADSAETEPAETRDNQPDPDDKPRDDRDEDGKPDDGDAEPRDGDEDGKPDDSHADNEPRDGDEDGKPDDSHADNEPRDGDEDGKPDDSHADNEPRDGDEDGKPDDSHADNEPRANEDADNEPRDGDAKDAAKPDDGDEARESGDATTDEKS